jgi:hypothetical protein
MKPFTLAVWITKFIASLVLLLAVVPGVMYFGGAYAVHRYEQRLAAKQVARDLQNDIENHDDFCETRRGQLKSNRGDAALRSVWQTQYNANCKASDAEQQ